MVTESNLNENDTIHPLSRVANSKIASVLDQLPTLDDVLHRHSQPPVCLYNYYIVLRDRLELEILLDFWLDVAQADILYKRYIKYATKRASTKFSPKQQHYQLPKPSISSSVQDYHQRQSNNSNNNNANDVLTHMLLLHPRASLATTMYSTTTNGSQPKKPPPTQTEMIEAIERIYLRYIVPSAEKEIIQLPASMKESIGHHFYDSEKPSSNTHPENPIIYAQAKEYVHQLLESTFPLFLRYKVFMNLTLPQQIGRLACGLVLLLVGFSLEFSLIFLNIHPWQKRLWVIFKSFPSLFQQHLINSLISRVYCLLFWVYFVWLHR